MIFSELSLYFCAHHLLIMRRLISSVLVIALFASCNNNDSHAPGSGGGGATDNTPPVINYSVIGTLPHDTSSFTEGLLFHDGQLYEATGTEPDMPASRRSLFGIVDPRTGKIDKKVELDRQKYFGEGIAFLNGKVYQLTYTTKVGYVYDAKTFKKLGEFNIPSNEGWGMTTDSTHLVMSDGSSNITYLDPVTFRIIKVLGVTDNNGPVTNINELELINGYLYANQWQTNYILKIDPATGKVVGRLDLSSLANEAKNKYQLSDSMNGIAYDPSTGKIYVTGKLWPNIYEIRFPI